MNKLEKRIRSRQLLFTVIAVALSVLTLRIIEQYGGPEAQISKGLEGLIHLVVAVSVFFLSEGLISCAVFAMPKETELPVSEQLESFIKRYAHVSKGQKAKFFLTLFETNGDSLVLKITFSDYLNLLAAATYFAQREWFATYTVPVSGWPLIAQNSIKYHESLRNAAISKQRVVVRPDAEIKAVSAENSIVRNTKDAGSQICFISKEKLDSEEIHSVEPLEDFALFDDSLVITAGKSPLEAELAGSPGRQNNLEKRIEVRILRGELVHPYIYWKTEIVYRIPSAVSF